MGIFPKGGEGVMDFKAKFPNYNLKFFLEGGVLRNKDNFPNSQTFNLQNMYQGALRLICSMVECVSSEYQFP